MAHVVTSWSSPYAWKGPTGSQGCVSWCQEVGVTELNIIPVKEESDEDVETCDCTD
jgi:hypothetical protein